MAPVRRSSRLREGVVLLAADLHNHTWLSDGAGDPARAFAALRAAGLDVAALTDHASIPRRAVPHLRASDYPTSEALAVARLPPHSIDAAGWDLTRELADAADVPGEFIAIRGFEWTEPWLGHANVWGSRAERDVHTPGHIEGLHDWLVDDEPDALFGYNHPGREPGRFADYALDPRLVDRMVGLELFNRTADFSLVAGRSPLVDCLAAGWRPGVVGCSDEHGPAYGIVGKGRTGVWAGEHTREGVRAALLARSTYATREPDLVLDATLGGVPAGAALPPDTDGSDLELAVDLDAGPERRGLGVVLELLEPGAGGLLTIERMLPAVVGEVTVARVEAGAAPWRVLRVVDPSRPEPTPGGPRRPRALAYASPWWAPPRLP